MHEKQIHLSDFPTEKINWINGIYVEQNKLIGQSTVDWIVCNQFIIKMLSKYNGDIFNENKFEGISIVRASERIESWI